MTDITKAKQDYDCRTILPSPKNTPQPTRDYCTWSEIKKKNRKHGCRRMDSDDNSSDLEDNCDIYIDTLAIPQPKNFLHGTLIKKLRQPDPTSAQLDEYWALKGTREWRDAKYAFIKWISANKELRFAGTPNVALFV